MNSVILAVVRLCTAVGVPRRAMLRARLAPITASPVTPMRLLAVGSIQTPSLARNAVARRSDGGGCARYAAGGGGARTLLPAFRRSATGASPGLVNPR